MGNRGEEERVGELWLVSPGHKVDLDEILKRVNVRRNGHQWPVAPVVPMYSGTNSVYETSLGTISI